MKGIFRKQLFSFAAAVLLIWAIGVLITFPIWLNRYVTRELQTLSEFTASYSDVSFSILKGKYSLRNFQLVNKTSHIKNPIFLAKSIDFSVCFKQLLYGKLAGKIVVQQPEISLVLAPGLTGRSQLDTDYPWRNISRRLLGITLNEIRIIGGTISYRDLQSIPNVTLGMQDINILISDIDAPTSNEKDFPAIASGTANLYNGKIDFSIEFNPQSLAPAFNLKARLENLDLAYFSDYLKGHGNYSIERGMFSVVAQASGDEQNISGFVKPLLKTIHLSSLKTVESLPLTTLTGFSKTYPQMAFQGDLKYSTLSIWSAVAFTMRNAFFEALSPVIRKIHTESRVPGYRPPTQRMQQKEINS